jgi:hypothetical protein
MLSMKNRVRLLILAGLLFPTYAYARPANLLLRWLDPQSGEPVATLIFLGGTVVFGWLFVSSLKSINWHKNEIVDLEKNYPGYKIMQEMVEDHKSSLRWMPGTLLFSGLFTVGNAGMFIWSLIEMIG